MTEYHRGDGPNVGSLWAVLGLTDARCVILAGPFTAASGAREFLVAPLYDGTEQGFVWTSEDVRLEATETGLGELYAAIWNARPVLESDLVFHLGDLPESAIVAVRDAYWASLNERHLGKNPRLGREIVSVQDPAAVFQARELERWEPLSGRVFGQPEDSAAMACFRFDDRWSMRLTEMTAMWRTIEHCDMFAGLPEMEAVGREKVFVRAWIAVGTRDLSPGYPGELFAPLPQRFEFELYGTCFTQFTHDAVLITPAASPTESELLGTAA